LVQPQGNPITLLIPMSSVAASCTNGVESRAERSFPIYDVRVFLVRGKHEYEFTPEVSVNVITIRERGQLPVGTYEIKITYRGTDQQPYTYRQRTLLQIVNFAKDGGQYENDEVDVIANYPVIKGRISAIDVTDSDVSISEGRGYTGDNTPNDGYADVSAAYGDNKLNITDDEVIITI
jgi:hypothetical protein